MKKIKLYWGWVKGISKPHPMAIHKGNCYMISHSNTGRPENINLLKQITCYKRNGNPDNLISYLYLVNVENINHIQKGFSPCFINENDM